MANFNKKTGDPSIHPNVRSAKCIAQAIIARFHASTAAQNLNDNNWDRGSSEQSTIENRIHNVKRGIQNSRSPVKKTDRLVFWVEQMTESVGSMVAAISNNVPRNVESVVRDEVRLAIKPIQDTLQALLEMVKKNSGK